MGWGQTDFANSTGNASGIAAVSRIPNSMEIWWVEVGGSVQGAYFYDGSPWGRYELAPDGSATYGNGITAVSRRSDTMEVFWIGKDGSVQNAHWYASGGGWQRFTLAPAGSAFAFGSINVVSRIPTSMEVWWVGADESIQGAYYYEGGSWQRYQLAPKGSAAPYTGITAATRMSNTMEVFWTAPDGSVQDAYWYEGSTWKQFALAPAGSADVTSGLHVISRIPTSMELFYIGADGSVCDSYWYDTKGWNAFVLAPAGSARKGGNIRGVSRYAGAMEVWYFGADGSVQDAYWYDASGWNHFQLAPPGSASPNCGLAAVSRMPGTMEVWWTEANGSLRDAFFYTDAVAQTQSAQVLTPAGTALGGTVDFTVKSDGTYTVKFHMHDSGIPNYKFQVRAIWAATNGLTLVVGHDGSVQGTESGIFSPPHRDDYDTEAGYSAWVQQNWDAVNAGKLWVTKDYSATGLAGVIGDVAKFVADLGATVAGGALGIVIGLGKDVGSLLPSLGIGETFGVVAGVVVFLATGSVVLAVIDGVAVGAITNALIKQRPLTPAEIAFAQQVFQNSIDYSKVVLTNLSGLGGRAFTFPGVDGKQYINITSAAYGSPLTYSNGAYPDDGQIFIHEMTHVWQSQHASFTPGVVCNGIVNQSNYLLGNDVYIYGPAGPEWSSFNLESQGAIVDQWFRAGQPRSCRTARRRIRRTRISCTSPTTSGWARHEPGRDYRWCRDPGGGSKGSATQ